MKDFIESMDWNLLNEQKMTLLKLMEYTVTLSAPTRDHIQGVIHLMDGLQDTAVDDYGVSEHVVFTYTSDDNEPNPRDVG